LTPLELSFISPDQPDEVILRRLCALLTLKQAYIKAIGQPMGFDFSRLEFNIPAQTAHGDGDGD
jgi:4'-phosphopantetheinyl transferase